MARGSEIEMHQTLIDGELWHLDRVELRLKARALWKNLNVDQARTYYGFRKFRVDSGVVFAR